MSGRGSYNSVRAKLEECKTYTTTRLIGAFNKLSPDVVAWKSAISAVVEQT